MIKMFVFLLSLSLAANAFSFVPEASGICRVGEQLIIAGDEEKKALFISSEKVEVKGAKWDDMESLASIDKTSFYGITSHSLKKNGKRKPEREQLIQFSMKGNQITAEKSWSLRDGILRYLATEARNEVDVTSASTATPDNGGLNIEGLAFMNNKLYLGLRSPLTKTGKAIILEVVNGRVTSWKAVDLKGRGIRDLNADASGLLILAGSTNDTDESFGLYQMSPSGNLSQTRYEGFSDLKRPEGIMKEADGSLIVVQDFMEEENQEFLVRLK